jgi:3-polyprenyl-4-hydroxybenzoate decarboxylase
MSVAIVIGWDQTLFLAASTPVNYPEYEMAGCLTGATPGRTNEGTTWTPATFSAMAWHYLEQAGVPNVTGVWRGKWPETMRVQIRKSHRGHAQQVANALWGCHLGNYAAKHVIVVDDDIDIHDWEALEWPLCYRVNAGLGDISFCGGTSGRGHGDLRRHGRNPQTEMEGIWILAGCSNRLEAQSSVVTLK